MLFFSNNAQKLQALGFKATKTMADADAAVFFGRDSLTEAESAASQEKTCFIIDAEGELGFFEIARLAFSGIIVLKNAAAVEAVVKYLGESQPVNAPGNEETSCEESSDLVAALFESAGDKPTAPPQIVPVKAVKEPEEPRGKRDALPSTVVAEEPYELIKDIPEEEPVPKEVFVPPPRPVAMPTRLETPSRSTDSRILDNLFAPYSPSTSVGKTFIAVNLAVWLARRGFKVALADLDPDKADLWHTTYMDAFGPPRVTVSNWADIVGDPVQHIAQHPNLPNLFVLPGTTVVGGPLPDATVVEEILRTLARRYDVVVADLNSLLRLSHIVAALRMAGKIFLLSDLSEKCVSQTSMILSQASGIAGRNRMTLVVNRSQRGQLYRPRDIAKMFGFAEFSEIPDDPKTVMSCLKSRRFPVATASPAGNALAKCFGKELAEFAEAPDELKPSRWKGLARLRRRVMPHA